MTTQMTAPSPVAQSGATRIDSGVVRFVPHESYDDPQRVRQILESIPHCTTDPECAPLHHPGHDYGIVERPLLTVEEECSLFERMNCLRSLAQKRLLDDQAELAGRRRVAARLLEGALEVRNEIMLANQRLIVSIAKKFQRGAVPLEDLIAEANITLSAAVNAFDCHRGFRFSTYATHAVTRRLARLTQRFQRQQMSETCVEPEILEVSLPSLGNDLDRTSAGELIADILISLPPDERDLMEQRYGLGSHDRRRTLAELGDAHGVSGESMRQRLRRICEKLRDSVDQHGGSAQDW